MSKTKNNKKKNLLGKWLLSDFQCKKFVYKYWIFNQEILFCWYERIYYELVEYEFFIISMYWANGTDFVFTLALYLPVIEYLHLKEVMWATQAPGALLPQRQNFLVGPCLACWKWHLTWKEKEFAEQRAMGTWQLWTTAQSVPYSTVKYCRRDRGLSIQQTEIKTFWLSGVLMPSVNNK